MEYSAENFRELNNHRFAALVVLLIGGNMKAVKTIFELLTLVPQSLSICRTNRVIKCCKGIGIILLIFSLMFLTACFHHVQLYSGEPRNESEEGTLMNNPQASSLWVIRVDDKDLGLERGPIQDTQACVLHLLPGEHTVFVTPIYYLFGWPSLTDECEILVREKIDGWLLKFTVEPGHNYGIGSQHTMWYTNEDDITFLECKSDSINIFRPIDWRSWSHYVCDEVPENRVSEIISKQE